MKKRLLFFIPLFLCMYALFCTASDTREIKWNDLIPTLPPQENPLAGLTEEETGFVEYIIYLREFMTEKAAQENPKIYKEMNEALPVLQKKGIDVDKIIADRKYRNTAINTELDNKVVKLGGYLLPLDLSGKAVKDFLLVPYFGACIHAPPPPPNQIIHAVSIKPTLYEVDDLFKPVSVTGKLTAKTLSKELFLSDGTADISIGYNLSVEKIENYQE